MWTLLHPPPGHHPAQQLSDASFYLHHCTVIVRGIEEGHAFAQGMAACTRKMRLRTESAIHTALMLMLPNNLQEEPFNTSSLKIIQHLVLSPNVLIIKLHANGIIPAFCRMTVYRQVQPLIHIVVFAVLIEPYLPPRLRFSTSFSKL